MTHPADIGIRLDNAGLFAALELAGMRGDLDGFKRALQQSYGPLAERMYNKAADDYYEYALKQAWSYMDAESEADIASLKFWTTIVEQHESRNDQ